MAHGWRASRPSRWRRRGIGVRAGWSQDLVRKQREERISTQFDLFLGLVWIISPPDGPSHFQGGSFSLNCLRNALIGTPRGVPYVIPDGKLIVSLNHHNLFLVVRIKNVHCRMEK